MAFVAGLVVCLAACAMPTPSSPPAEATLAALDVDDLLPRSGRSVLVVGRDRGDPASPCLHRVSLDGKAVADLHPGDWVTLYPLPGRHTVGVHASGSGCSGDGALALTLAAGDEQAVRTRVDAGGTVAIVVAPR